TVELDVAAREAVTKVQPFVQALAEAESDCHAAAEHVEALRKLLEEDEKALEEAVTALSREADQVEKETSSDAHGATASIGYLVLAFRQAGTNGTADLDAETGVLENARTLLTELAERVEELAAAAEAAAQAALDETALVVHELDEMVTAAENLVSADFVSFVADIEDRLEKFSGAMVTFLSETCKDHLDERAVEFIQKLMEARQFVNESLAHVEAQAVEVMDYTEGMWTHRMDVELTEVETDVGTLLQELNGLAQAAVKHDDDLKAAAEVVEERLRQAARAASGAQKGSA